MRPFWLARGLSTDEIGLINGTLGVVAAIAGGLAGGMFMGRFGIFRGLWFFGLCQCVSHLTYALVAAYPHTGHIGVYVASVAESFCSGLGTAAFLAFLMSICNRHYSATQYALLSALFRVTGIIAGAVSGWTTDMIGYAYYFALTFILPLPAFAFLVAVKSWIPEERLDGDAADRCASADRGRTAATLEQPKELPMQECPIFAENPEGVLAEFSPTPKVAESRDYVARHAPPA